MTIGFSAVSSRVDGTRAIFLACAALAGAAATLVALDARLKLLVLASAAGAAALFLFFHPRIAFLAWALLVPTQFFWTDDLGLLPRQVRFADDALLLLLTARAVAERLRKGLPFRRTPWDLSFLAFLGVGVVSALVNHTPFANAAAGLRAPILFALVLYVVANAPESFDREFLAWLWKPLLLLAGVQILACVYQYPARGFYADSLTGTLGPSGANDVGVYLLPFLFYLLSRRFDAGDRRLVVLLGILSMAGASILSGSRASWFIGVFAALLLWGKRLLRLRAFVPAAIVGAAVFAFIARIVVLEGAPSVEEAIGPRGILASLLLVSTGGGNLAYFPIVWRLVDAFAPVPLLGLGPGMVSSTAAVHLDAPLYRNVLYDYFGQTRFGLDGSVESQILATAGELGPLGFLAMLSTILIWAAIAWRSHRDPGDSFERAVAAGVFAAALGAVLLTPIRNVWETPHLAFSLWLPGALLYACRSRRGPLRESARVDIISV